MIFRPALNKRPAIGLPREALSHSRAAQPAWNDSTVTYVFAGMTLALFLAFSGRPILEAIRWPLFCLVVTPFIYRRSELLRQGLRGMRTFYPLLVMGAATRLASTLWSPEPVYTFQRAVAFGILILFLLIGSTSEKQGFKPRRVAGLVAGWGAVIVLSNFALWASRLGAVPLSGLPIWLGGRFAGLFGNPNQIGVCFAVSLPLIFALWLEKRARWPLLAITVMALLILFVTRSRAGVLSIGLGFTTVLLILMGVDRLAARLILIVLLVSPLVVLESERVESAWRYVTRTEGQSFSLTETAESRLVNWRLGWESIRKHPLLGQGYGIGGVGSLKATNVRYTDYDRGLALHNSYLQTWQEDGLIGILPLAALMLGTLRRLRAPPGLRSDQRFLHAGFAGIAAAGLTNAFFESWLYSIGNIATLPFWLSLTMLWLIHASSPPPNPGGRKPARSVTGPR